MSYPGPPAPSRLRCVLRPWIESGLDLLYPCLCCVCRVPLPAAASRGSWFCEACEAELPLVQPPYCRVCGEIYDGSFTGEFRCMNCEGRRLAFDFAVAACRAEGALRELIHQFKYGRQLRLRGPLAVLLRLTLEEPRLMGENLAEWLLTPVPLHRSREMDREFNQSWELCQRLHVLTGIPAAQTLSRVRETDSQAGLDRDERLKNLHGAFALRKTRPWQEKPALQGRCILLVDDVFTTGATTSECARVLRKEGGAEKVVVITVARG